MEHIKQVVAALQEAQVPFVCDEPLKKYTTIHIGGPAAVFCKPETTTQFMDALQVARQVGVPHYILGLGSNVIFGDEGYYGVIIHMPHVFTEIKVLEETITAGAGAKLSELCVYAQKNALTGLEFAFGIPGSVGGAVYMNAGAYSGEMCQVLESVEILDEVGNIRTIPAQELELGYRESIFQHRPWVVLRATVKLKKGDATEIQTKMDDLMNRRRDKQPLELPSAGSAFKRPPGAFAGALIDQCGFRGFSVGDAAISEKHCGFIVNLGNATCAELLELANTVSAAVQQQTGHVLEKELRIIAPTTSL